MTTTKDDEKKAAPPKAPPPDDSPKGVLDEDDRASRIAPSGPDAVKVHKGTVTL